MSAPVDSAATGHRHDEYASDVAVYREEFRRWLRELTWADEWRSAVFDNAEDELAQHAAIMGRLHEAGWNRYGWPQEFGGLGGNEVHRAAYFDELAAAMLPVPEQHWTLEVIGPATYTYAPELAAQVLPNYLRGAEWWGQCFSEPESGSDLASLRCRASDDGAGGFVLNGQKIWTSQGPTATRFMVLARTGTPESRHRGLSTFLVDADTPGVTVRPITLASGRRELAEVFFDDVRVPRDRLIGDVGAGWGVVMYLMQYERGMYGYAVTTTALTELGRLRHEIVAHGASQAHRERFAQTYVAVLAAQARGATTVRTLADGRMVGPESSVDKLLFARAEKDINDLVLDVRRDWVIAGAGEGDHTELDAVRAKWWYTRAATIMGGSAEVQKGIIADHLLGLPKEKR
ncbi:acyl-CoA dehydrogenase [Mycolicibacterium madagascariense]|uniref:Acyl-CoA dehydrogenase n=1 Tax=Mycolicibacterium madagascariense TaxID=212765 RepID=A0A7I7XCG5_9MYCO|nr:acyl-CoA dehydrogenase family protein [Mycolicibacterium madagascariense]MCV7011693.1 acyl-CoA dehydrogenase family protein [Mycolicibacterium madagascariense]BBZ27326.1 acyl-CoA dehydrogenase [Mycolicibacterium madagascariense]